MGWGGGDAAAAALGGGLHFRPAPSCVPRAGRGGGLPLVVGGSPASAEAPPCDLSSLSPTHRHTHTRSVRPVAPSRPAFSLAEWSLTPVCSRLLAAVSQGRGRSGCLTHHRHRDFQSGRGRLNKRWRAPAPLGACWMTPSRLLPRPPAAALLSTPLYIPPPPPQPGFEEADLRYEFFLPPKLGTIGERL